ncbi:ABC transporter permease [Oceanibacterium hippocampi]|uniref:Sulfate transport system permease protein CysW n=1 Tax=Oceanibacterium hippocampi TaxID=745714 RepID=A0A1Y5THQ4_9PROT|nr:ABC transporter permease [Oceanibacterium hippocampi]SLN60579.1 Sulfate transport system permease protein CysW [Oceanibacterium hippocampi]
MTDILNAFVLAIELIFGGDPEFVEIVGLSLYVSLTAVGLASLIGLPLGALVAVYRFPGRGTVIVILNSLMALPPVFVGLFLYLLLSRSGPLGFLGLLYTPGAMILAQCVLATPIVAALAHQAMRTLYEEYMQQLCSLGARTRQVIPTVLWDGRLRLVSAVMAGFGRVSAEVGAVLIVGGNIANVTRVMTTTIALETSKGNLALAMALGLVLLLIALGVNAAAVLISRTAR